MIIIILNEKNYVEKILSGEAPDLSKVYMFISIYARYLYHENGIDDEEKIISELDKYMHKNYKTYNCIEWQSSFEKYAKNAYKYPLCKCDGVQITSNEIASIKELNDKALERLAFTLLCLAKFMNFKNPKNDGWVNCRSNEIFSMACITASSFEKDMKFNKLKEYGKIKFANKINNLNIKVLFIDKNTDISDIKDEDKISAEKMGKTIFVSDFRRLGYEWRVHDGEKKYIRCEKCRILMKKRSRNNKFCKKCAPVAQSERRKKYYKKCKK